MEAKLAPISTAHAINCARFCMKGARHNMASFHSVTAFRVPARSAAAWAKATGLGLVRDRAAWLFSYSLPTIGFHVTEQAMVQFL